MHILYRVLLRTAEGNGIAGISSISHTFNVPNACVSVPLQVFTTASPAPPLGLVWLHLQATSSSALASSTLCASPAVTRHFVTGHATRSDPNHRLPSACPHHGHLCFVSLCSFCCADRDSSTADMTKTGMGCTPVEGNFTHHLVSSFLCFFL